MKGNFWLYIFLQLLVGVRAQLGLIDERGFSMKSKNNQKEQKMNYLKLNQAYKFKTKNKKSNSMGPRQSSQSRSRQKQFFQNYEMIQELPNDNIRFLEHKQTKKEYLLRQLSYNSKQQYLKAIETIKNKRQQLKNSDHLIPLTEYFEKQEDQYCSTFYKLYVMYEYPQRTLDDEINQRNLRKNTFTETELWSILASCILGLSHLQKKGIKHGSLRSSMIFLSQEGLIKISDPFTTGCQTNYDTLLNKRSTRHIYLSPQQCQALQGELISLSNINQYKSDIFTLGMIMLQSGLLQYQDECYRDQYSRIHIETLQYNKNRFRKNYSQELANMLNYMLGQDPATRPEWIELENYVITDNTSKSFISDGRKSNIVSHSKPVSVIVDKKKLVPESNHPLQIQNVIVNAANPMSLQTRNSISNINPISFQTRNSISKQPSISQQKNNYNLASVINKGIGISSSKNINVHNLPGSITNNNYHAASFPNTIYPQNNIQPTAFISRYPEPPVISPDYRPLTKLTSIQATSGVKKPITTTNIPSYQNKQNTQNIQKLVHLQNFSPTISNLTNFSKPYVSESPVNNQILAKNFQIAPVKASNISTTRPLRSIFPNPVYFTKTKVDQNLVQVEEDDQTSVSQVSSYNNYQNSIQKNDNPQVSNGHYQNFKHIANNLNQKPYQMIQGYSHQQNYTNFTPQSNTFPPSSNPSYQNSPPPHDSATHSKSSFGEFVIETFKLGSRYEGYKQNGMRHGLGKFYYQDGGMYDGNWVHNKMEGYGKLFYQSGKIAYDGQWIQDQFTGQGTLYNQTPDPLIQPFNYQNFDKVQQFWTKYEGQFLDDSKNGRGILYLSNGQYFEGNFVNDNVEGEGVFSTMTGDKIKGLWEANQLVRIL